jgi:hypothetical protein
VVRMHAPWSGHCPKRRRSPASVAALRPETVTDG